MPNEVSFERLNKLKLKQNTNKIHNIPIHYNLYTIECAHSRIGFQRDASVFASRKPTV